jgi:AcrR family transcriptional regulator
MGPSSAKECETDMQDAGSAPRTDTRARVQKVALELFAEQGYEKTSLREIAERLGVTKAALYYHFKSKEDIVHSFTDDYFAEIDGLLDWAKDQPRTGETQLELLDRYVGIVLAGSEVFRFLEQNRAAVQTMETGKDRFARFRDRLDTLVDLLAGPDAPLRERVRATAATITVGAICHVYRQQVDDPDKLRAIILEIATDLIR